MNKIKFEPYGDLVDQAFCQINQDAHSQIENDESSRAKYRNENDSEDTETKHLQSNQVMKSQKV